MRTCLFVCFLIFSCLTFKTFGQKADSLREKSNRYLVEKLNTFEFKRGDTSVWIYLNAYIDNAKERNDFETLFYGYKEGSFYSKSKDQKLNYIDSAIIAAGKTENPDLIAQAYNSKGIVFYEFRDYKKTLDNYLKASELLSDSKNDYLKYKIIYGISVIKSYLGYYKEALESLSIATEFFDNEDDPNYRLMYLRSLFRTGEIYQSLNEHSKATEINLLGLQKSIKFNEKVQEQFFNLAIGIDDYFAGNYMLSIQNIKKSLPILKKNGHFELEEKGNFYAAKSYLKLKQDSKALLHFQKIDSLFNQHQYLDPTLRDSYEWLIEYYKKHDLKDQQLYYVNQLLKIDNLNSGNTQYLTYKIHKEYDTKKLLETRKELERNFIHWQYYTIGAILLLLVISITLFIHYRKARLKTESLKKQFDELIKNQDPIKTQIGIPKRNSTKEIPPDVIEDILNRLHKFEEKKEFLNRNIDQKSLAEKFKTNTSYLSKIINTYKETNFNGYLNKLRINHLIELLKQEPKYRLYTVEALSEIAGFTSSRHFSDIFFTETGLRPTYFLEEIRKKEKIS